MTTLGLPMAEKWNEGLHMTSVKNTPAEPNPPAGAPGDNRGADDVDGNKAGAKTGNKTPGPNAPEGATETGAKVPGH